MIVGCKAICGLIGVSFHQYRLDLLHFVIFALACLLIFIWQFCRGWTWERAFAPVDQQRAGTDHESPVSVDIPAYAQWIFDVIGEPNRFCFTTVNPSLFLREPRFYGQRNDADAPRSQAGQYAFAAA